MNRPSFPDRARPHPEGRVLVLLCHPALHKSRVNRRLAAAAREVPGVAVHDLYRTYPDFDLDVPHEQALLEHHGAVVLQFPMYWYSTPALLKEWQDQVLLVGWAYGPKGRALQGKRLQVVVSTGGAAEAYAPGGHKGFTLRQLLAPLEATAHLCGLRYEEPFATSGTHALDADALDAAAARYQALLQRLVEAA